MNLIGYEPWNALNLAHRDLSRLLGLGGFGHKESEHSPAWREQWSPAVDVREEDDRFVLTVDLPGIDPKAVKITAEKGVLTISGERHLAGRPKERTIVVSNRFTASSCGSSTCRNQPTWMASRHVVSMVFWRFRSPNKHKYSQGASM